MLVEMIFEISQLFTNQGAAAIQIIDRLVPETLFFEKISNLVHSTHEMVVYVVESAPLVLITWPKHNASRGKPSHFVSLKAEDGIGGREKRREGARHAGRRDPCQVLASSSNPTTHSLMAGLISPMDCHDQSPRSPLAELEMPQTDS